MIKPNATLLAIIGMLIYSGSTAQTLQPVSADDVMSMANKNNLLLQSQQFNVQSSQSLKRSVFELPKTNVNVQYGQYNSINQDLGFNISQSIPFPTYYSARSGLYKAQLQGAQFQQQVSANEIKAQVLQLFYQLQYLYHNKKQLFLLDSAYADFVKAAELRYKTGETYLLEKTTAETKRGQIQIMLKQNESEIASAYAMLKASVNTKEDFSIAEGSQEPLSLSITMDTALISNNSSLKLMYQQALIAEKNRKLEVASVLPDLSIGYFNQSLMGVQSINGEDVYFDRSKRFTGINAGIAIPLTFFSNSARIKSFNYQKQSLEKAADNEKLALQAQLQGAFQQYGQSMSQYNYYKTSALVNANTIISTAKLSFNSGEIGYIEYLQALQTATEVQLGFLAAVNQVNQSVININYLINK